MLHSGMNPPFSLERFLKICEELIPEKDFQLLNTLPQAEAYSEKQARHPTVQGWIEFDSGLRNELVRTRASRKHVDPGKYVRSDGYSGSSLMPVALAAQRNPSVIDAEKMLDETRWKALEELAFGHYFDLEFLITYAYKLMILERWEKIRNADKAALLEQTLHN